MPSPSSSVQQAREALGARLREIRNDAGLTGQGLAGRAGWHSSKVSRIELGTQNPSPDDIRAWCLHCGAEAQTRDLLASLQAVDGMWVEWSRLERGGLRRAQEVVLPLYERTKNFRAYDSWLIPGVLQTADYTTALLEAIAARRDVPGDDIPEAVAVRMARQKIIHEGEHRFAIVLEESVLRSRIGGVDTMAGQLGHLLAVASLPSISLGVIPMTAIRTLRAVEGFWIFDDERVNVELVSGWLTITRLREIAAYARAFAQMAAMAVYGPRARSLVTAALAALDG